MLRTCTASSTMSNSCMVARTMSIPKRSLKKSAFGGLKSCIGTDDFLFQSGTGGDELGSGSGRI